MSDSTHVLIIGFVWPEPQSSAAGQRMMQLISLFEDEGWQVTFASSAAESGHSVDLSDRGISTEQIKINDSSFDKFVGKLQPDIVVFDRFVIEEQFGWRVAEQCPNALRILDTEDLHCLRRARKIAVRENRELKKQDLFSDNAKREVASIYRSDLSLMISEAEIELLRDVFNVDGTLLCYLPYLLDPIDKKQEQEWPSFEERDHFVSIGNFRHDPNMDAVEYLNRDIWPLIRNEMPNAELHIYGAYVGQQAEQLHDPSNGFLIKGRAENANQVVQNAKVMLAPLRFGAGLKGKLIEAMQCGTPSVTTEVGAEGINAEYSWAGKIAEQPEHIARYAVRLYNEKQRWKKAQANGISVINNRFMKRDFGPELVNKINDRRKNIEEYRLRNFTGQMLLHHTMSSTKFMSRWIEAKNS